MAKTKSRTSEKKMYVKDRTQKFSIDEMNLGLKLKGRKYFYGLNELLPPPDINMIELKSLK